MRELSLFSGAGGGLLATVHLLGWTPVGYVEIDDYCQRVLAARIADGLLPEAPIFGDIRAFAAQWAERYRGMVDVVTAGFPCQPFSVAGKQRAAGDSRNMWPETIRVIRQVRPRFAFLENVPGLLAGFHGYFGTALGDLAESGFHVPWDCLGTADVGGNTRRTRLWLVAVADEEYGKTWVGSQRDGQGWAAVLSGNYQTGLKRRIHAARRTARGLNGVAHRVDRLRATGNGQVPTVAAAAWSLLMEER